MARLPRLAVPGYPHHIILRGNDRQAIFRSDADRERMLQVLGEYAAQFHIALHAYVLMDNHLHLLATPSTDGLPSWMQAVGRRYVRYFNDRHGRTGTLWEGRYRSTLIDADRYLLACMAYMDLNPVRAALVVQPGEYRWSSYAHYAGKALDRGLTPHALYWTLGNTPFAREAAYAELVHAGIRPDLQQDLTAATLSGWALGDAEFLTAVQKLTERRLSRAPAGRPSTVNKS